MHILHRDDDDGAVGGVHSITVLDEQTHEESEERDKESEEIAHQAHTRHTADILVGDVVDDIKIAETAGEEEHADTEDDVPGVKECVKTTAGISPMAYDGLHRIKKV